MSRGRHRHSPPLHRLLPPSTVAGASIACAAGAWFVGDDLVQRVLAAGAAAAAVTGAVLLRTWDRKAGKRVADLTRARARDEWRTEERIAELETDVEESREIRAALDTKLRAKRAELARLRSEHAELLRRYATAETERASALEGRRLLAIEAGTPDTADGTNADANGADALNANANGADGAKAKAVGTVKEAASGGNLVPARREPSDGADRAPARRTATFAEADRALCRLAGNAARQREDVRNRQSTSRPQRRAQVPAQAPAKAPGGRHAKAGQDGESGQGKPEAAGQGKPEAAVAQRTGGDARATRTTTTPGGLALRPVPAAAAAIAPPRPTVSRTLGGFDFFGNASVSPRQLTAPLEDDLADVVGDEAVAEQSARAGARAARAEAAEEARTARTADAAEATDEADVAEEARPEEDADGAAVDGAAADAPAADGETTHGAGEVIDLTAHDETEQLDLAELRSAIS